MADSNGLATVLELLGARGEVAGDGGAQSELFDAADAPMPLEPAKGKSGPKGGRPAGARNRSTEEWARFMLAQYRSPLVVLAELYSRPTGELVDQLQAMADKHKSWRETKDGGYYERVAVSPVDVLRMQRDAAVALAPYLHQQQPKAITVENRPHGIVVLGHLDGAEDVSDELALPLPKTEENQGGEIGARPQSEAQLQPENGKASDASGLTFDEI